MLYSFPAKISSFLYLSFLFLLIAKVYSQMQVSRHHSTFPCSQSRIKLREMLQAILLRCLVSVLNISIVQIAFKIRFWNADKDLISSRKSFYYLSKKKIFQKRATSRPELQSCNIWLLISWASQQFKFIVNYCFN